MYNSVYLFLNIGTGELMLIFFVALLLFGGDKLPGLARTLGRGIRDFKNASEDVKREINSQINSFDDKRERKAEKQYTDRYYESDVETPPLPPHYDNEVAATENPVDDNIVDETVNVAENTENGNAETKPKPEFTKPANTIEFKN